MGNDRLMADLDRWARADARIDPRRFGCRHYDECDASTDHSLARGQGCRMSYVGSHYGCDIAGITFRLVLVGIDHGDFDSSTYESCRTGLEQWYQRGGYAFNPHYAGVAKTAAAVFGKTGEYCKKFCKKSCRKSRDPKATQCVLDRVAQPNMVKCAPSDQVGRTSRATWTMQVNCAHHLINELKLLNPHLVVFHGANARGVILPTLTTVGMYPTPINSRSDRHGPVLYDVKSIGSRFLFLNHPTRGWLNRQWNTVVVPNLKYLRGQKLIPS